VSESGIDASASGYGPLKMVMKLERVPKKTGKLLLKDSTPWS
jgi:hypothetical protein